MGGDNGGDKGFTSMQNMTICSRDYHITKNSQFSIHKKYIVLISVCK